MLTHDVIWTVSGGAGAVGVVVGKAILESGGDVVFLDRLESMPEDKWRKSRFLFQGEH